MNLKQLKFFCAVVDCGFNMWSAASALHTSQPSISRHIQALEDELEVAIFRRGRKRINGLTRPGAEALKVARRMLQDSENLHQLGRDFSAQDSGRLVITTSHTHARYALPKVIEKFTSNYPKVHVSILQGHPVQITQWLTNGDADISISSNPSWPVPSLAMLPCYEYPIVILACPGHPLLTHRPVSIVALVKYPLITYNSEFSIHRKVMRAFELRNLEPNIVLSATEVDVMKTYVKQGMGVAIVSAPGYDPKGDRHLNAIDAKHLFGSTPICLGVRKFSYLRSYTFHFISLFSPALSRDMVTRAIFDHADLPRRKQERAVPTVRS
ncbi:MAG: hypothetical protein A3G24_22280 [Betaproteobacteria bacterium RIFCSPLOWO2_12_FULL_62_13]|nr:MAG: hypothetical protein A3G24_22280 [Betaproteobacteria bacterium RIFCSPLOWO2_12_FULL_62_13]